ncbi:hypothetical protein KSS87_015647 [Heliosperma pusillum]|nr:hypothetical protein KSS87_015647 [Heliosperma pusillum]
MKLSTTFQSLAQWFVLFMWQIVLFSDVSKTSPSLCFRRDFSSVPPVPGPANKPSGSGGNFSKILAGSAAIGACFAAAYTGGYLDDILGKKQRDAIESGNTSFDKLPKQDGSLQESHTDKEPLPEHTGSKPVDSHAEETKYLKESQSPVDLHVDSSNLKPTIAPHVKVDELPISSDDIEAKKEERDTFTVGETSKDGDQSLEKSFDDTAASVDKSSSGEQSGHGLFEANEKLSTVTDGVTALQVSNVNKDQPSELMSQIEQKDMSGHEQGQSPSLLSTYSLNNEADERNSNLSEHHIKQSSTKEEISHGAVEDKGDGKLIVDFLQAIHAAEQRQAELDALVLAEERRALKDKYEKELRDARARELMYAEEAAMLEKEIKKERAKAAAALKSLQERAEERLKTALEEKEREVECKLKEVEDFAKAELAASIAREKAAQIERMAEADLNISALCMAFYARSEEARQTHSIHKLALGALALEDALSNGLPVQAELNALGVYIENVDKDSLLQLAVLSLPEDVRLHGTDSFNALKGSLRHFSLIPPDGGGILAHSLARVASFLKVKEADQSGDGIESVMNKVEGLLAAGKLVEAADALEDGVKGSKATEVVSDWLRMVRNRAIAEQALVLLQSYATSMSLT